MMNSPWALGTLRRALPVLKSQSTLCPRNSHLASRQPILHPQHTQHNQPQSLRAFSTTSSPSARLDHASTADDSLLLSEDDDFTAAPEIDFEEATQEKLYDKAEKFLRGLRIVPASPAYFNAKPKSTDDYLYIQMLLRRYITLPIGEAPKVKWRSLDEYRRMADEMVKTSKYQRMIGMLKRLNRIHPELMPVDVRRTVNLYLSSIQPSDNQAAPILVDSFGRAAAVGRRKSSSAKAWVVEGDGEVLINGKPLHQAFARVHDRQSVIWALKATNRVDKYNVWATVHGGGTTGQAEALTLAVSKALMAHEPGLKTSLRTGE